LSASHVQQKISNLLRVYANDHPTVIELQLT